MDGLRAAAEAVSGVIQSKVEVVGRCNHSMCRTPQSCGKVVHATSDGLVTHLFLNVRWRCLDLYQWFHGCTARDIPLSLVKAFISAVVRLELSNGWMESLRVTPPSELQLFPLTIVAL